MKKEKVLKYIHNQIIRPQSLLGVLEANLDLVVAVQPKTILEIGFGRGDWSLASACILDSNPEYFGIDNFSVISHAKTTNDEEKDWPDSISKLSYSVKLKKQLLGLNNNFTLENVDVTNTRQLFWTLNQFKKEFDLIRLDCLCQNKEQIRAVLDILLKFTAKDFVLFVDDAGASGCLVRLLACLDLVEEGKLIPIWFSEDEVAFANPEYNIDSVYEKFYATEKRYFYRTVKDFHHHTVKQNYPVLVTKLLHDIKVVFQGL